MTYTKQEWIDQQTVISAARMDHIESGVETAHGLADGLDVRLAANEGLTGGLDQRVTTAEGLTDDLDTRLTAAEGAISAAPQIQSGRAVVTPDAASPTSVDVVFPAPFSAPPEMTASALSGVPGTVQEVTVDAITTTGARIWIRRTSAVSTSISWIAVAPR